MIPANAVATQIQTYLRTQDPQPLVQAVDAVQDIQALFTVGERVHAIVTDQLKNGRFAVLIKDQLLDLNLPRNTQPGDQLDLKVLYDTPKLTFLLQARQAAALAVPASSPRDEADTPTKEAGSAPVELSKTARFVGELMGQAAKGATVDRPAVALVQARPPLITGAAPDTAKLANRMQAAISQSGLFYESHQAEWISGTRPLATLLQEPQATLFARATTVATANATANANVSVNTGSTAALLADDTPLAEIDPVPVLDTDVPAEPLPTMPRSQSLVASSTAGLTPMAPAEVEVDAQALPQPGSPAAILTDTPDSALVLPQVVQMLDEQTTILPPPALLPSAPNAMLEEALDTAWLREAERGQAAKPTLLPGSGVPERAVETSNKLKEVLSGPIERRQVDTVDTLERGEKAAVTPLNLTLNMKHPIEEMPAALRQLVQQQLETLDRRQIAWEGQAWQGQAMRWEIEQDGGRSPTGPEQAPDATVWRSRLQLDLPHLGPINALVTLTGKAQVDVRFSVAMPNTVERIRQQQEKLDSALQAAGLKLSSNLVALDAQDPSRG